MQSVCTTSDEQWVCVAHVEPPLPHHSCEWGFVLAGVLRTPVCSPLQQRLPHHAWACACMLYTASTGQALALRALGAARGKQRCRKGRRRVLHGPARLKAHNQAAWICLRWTFYNIGVRQKWGLQLNCANEQAAASQRGVRRAVRLGQCGAIADNFPTLPMTSGLLLCALASPVCSLSPPFLLKEGSHCIAHRATMLQRYLTLVGVTLVYMVASSAEVLVVKVMNYQLHVSELNAERFKCQRVMSEGHCTCRFHNAPLTVSPMVGAG